MSIQRTLTRGASTGDTLPHAGTAQRDDRPTIDYDIAGDGPPVVFIHGLTSVRQTWNPITTRERSALTRKAAFATRRAS